MREYQKNFYTLYEHFQDNEIRINKADKIRYVLEKVNVHNPDGICLDIGCSSGIITKKIAPLFKKVIGLDFDIIAMKMIDQNAEENLKYAYGDAMRLPFGDEKFDAIICSQTYEHVPSDIQLFSEVKRVLKPGGIVYFSGPNKTFPVEPHYYLPFLQMLPEKWANRYLQLTGKGDEFYERSRTYWNLKKIFRTYQIIDAVILVLDFFAKTKKKKHARSLYKVLSKIPTPLWKLMSPFIVNFNWVLIKKENPGHGKTKIRIASAQSPQTN